MKDQAQTSISSGSSTLVEKGDSSLVEAKPDQALEYYERALRLDPRNAAAMRGKANVLRKLGRLSEALEYYELSAKSEPDNHAIVASTLISKGDVLLNLGEYNRAVAEYEKAQRLEPGIFPAPDWTVRGDKLAGLNRLDEGFSCYENAIAADQKYFWAWRGKGLLLAQQGNTEEALKCFDVASELDTTNAWIWVDKGNIFYARGQFKAALDCYDEAIKKEPNYSIAHVNKGLALQAMSDYEAALETFNLATTLNRLDDQAWLNKGAVLLTMNRTIEAIECFDRVLAISADSLWAWNYKGLCMGQLGKSQEALELFDRAISIDRAEIDPWFNKADLLARMDRYDDAMRCVEEAYAVVRDKDSAALALARVKGGYSHSITDLQSALPILQKAITRNPSDYPNRANLAELYIRLGHYSEARAEAAAVVDRKINDQLQLIGHYLALVSYSLEGDRQSRAAQFTQLIDCLSNQIKAWMPLDKFWLFRSLIQTIVSSNLDSEDRFLLLTTMDILTEKIPRDRVSFLMPVQIATFGQTFAH